MALVTCPDCSNQYDQAADHCPNCGHPNPLKQPGGAGGPGRGFEAQREAEPLRPAGGSQAGGQSYGGAGAAGGQGYTAGGPSAGAGGPGYTAGGPAGGAGGAGYGGGARPDIPNYLVFAIFLALCCCPPFAIPALINAARVDARRDLGDVNGAWEASRQAKKWCFIALGVGLLVWIACSVGYGALVAYAVQMAEQQGLQVEGM